MTTQPTYEEERPQWKCDLALLMGKLVGRRDADFDTPLEEFIDKLLSSQRDYYQKKIDKLEGELNMCEKVNYDFD
jgi:hypothetical protein